MERRPDVRAAQQHLSGRPAGGGATVTAMAAPRPVRDGSETFILVLFTLLCVGSVTLFMVFGAEVAGVKIKPFDAVSILTLPPILAVLALGRGLRVSSGT